MESGNSTTDTSSTGNLAADLRSVFSKAHLSVPLALAILLIGCSFYHFLLFHTLAELVAIIIGMLMFAVAWNVYPYSRNNFLMFVACGYFWIAFLDLFHALTYKGMTVFMVADANPASHLWIVARYMESIVLLIAPLFLFRALKRNTLFLLFMLATISLLALIMSGTFPVAYIEGQGLTRFKIVSEYIIILILASALVHLGYRRKLLARNVYYLMASSIILTMLAELAFTFYVSVYGLSNLVGHIFKLFSYWLLFIAIVRTTLVTPYAALRSEIGMRKCTEKALTSSNRALRVLTSINEILTGAESENELLKRVCQVIVHAGDYRLAWVGYNEDDENKSLHVMASAGVDAAFLRHPDLTWAEPEEGDFTPGEAIRNEQGIVIQDIFSDSDCVPCRDDAKEYGFSSLIALPLSINERVFGVLAIYAADVNTFSTDEINLLSELANDLAFGIQALRTHRDHELVSETLSETEEKFRNLSEQALVGVYLVQDGVFKYVNPRFAELFGYESGEIIGRLKPEDVVIPEDWPVVRENLRKRMDGEVQSMHYEFRVFRKDHSVMDVEVFGNRSIYQGKPAVLGSLLDITQRVHADEAIRASENKFRTIVDAEPECVKLLDTHGNLVEMNPAGLAMLEVESPEQVIGKSILPFVMKKDQPAFKELAGKVLKGESGTLQFEITGSKGTHRFMETHAVPIIDNGKVSNLLAVTRDISQHKQAEQVLLDSAKEKQRLLTQTVQSVALTVEKRDPYTAGHQSRVAELSVLVAREMGLDEERIIGIHLGAIIHDIGKIYVPAEILNRPGRLTDSEFSIVKSHAEVGYEIMKDVQFPWAVNEIIYQHHERMDGTGYPQGLKGDEIALEARIVGVADVLEAISSHRPYRAALGLDKAIEEIQRGRGLQYDADVVDACERLFENGKFNL
jgi:PAS domain S-box-containing protein/putative nucleotidyltransferase with HDIG domain